MNLVFMGYGDKEFVVELLKSSDVCGNKMSVIPIVEIGAIGKITLLQTLSNFALGDHDRSSIKLSKELPHLWERLSISGLQNVGGYRYFSCKLKGNERPSSAEFEMG